MDQIIKYFQAYLIEYDKWIQDIFAKHAAMKRRDFYKANKNGDTEIT